MDKILQALSKSIVFSALFVNAQLLCAGSMGQEISILAKSGFYVGGDIGLSNLIDAESHSVLPESHQLSATGIVGGGLLGYDYAFQDKVILGIEAFINANGLNTAISRSLNIAYKQNSRYNWGVRVLPKYLFTPNTDGHLLLGYTQANFNLNDNGVYGLLNTSFNKSGFQGGLGFTNTLANNLLIRLDALYSIYANNSNIGTGSNLSASINQVYKNQFSTLEGNVSLIYKLN